MTITFTKEEVIAILTDTANAMLQTHIPDEHEFVIKDEYNIDYKGVTFEEVIKKEEPEAKDEEA